MARHPQCEELLVDSSYNDRVISLIAALDAIDQSGAPARVQNAVLNVLKAWDPDAAAVALKAHLQNV